MEKETATVEQAVKAKQQSENDTASLIGAYREKYHPDVELCANTEECGILEKESNVDKYFKIANFASAILLLIICVMVPLWAIIHPDVKGVSAPTFIAGSIMVFSGSILVREAYKELKGTKP